MLKILALDNISQKVLDTIDSTKYEVVQGTTDNIEDDVDIILLRSSLLHDVELPESVKAIARCGAGYNNIPTEKCAEQGIVVFNTPGANANAVAELATCALFLTGRDIIGGANWVNDLDGDDDVAKVAEKGKKNFVGPEIRDKTLAVIGLGNIGSKLAKNAVAMGMNVIGYDPFLSNEAVSHLPEGVQLAHTIEETMDSDYISLHLALSDDTRGMINAEFFSKCKPGLRLLNYARGEIVNIPDLIEAINSGKVAKYATDFAMPEVLRNDNIICTPHLGATTPESEENCAAMAVNQVRQYLEYGNIINSVNYPNCDIAIDAKYKICVLCKGNADAVGTLSNIFAEAGADMIEPKTNTRGDYSFVAVGTNTPPQGIIDKINEREKVRAVFAIEM
ncbi:MAG: 3-phosphoglycerate dehydrogenase [Clostridiales bacterium]|jgi:D-3-phosphoglycerate dehydrogenase|nr:3-phosphoglycerate dehydrogenase [Clostridiales bacterium]